MRSPRRSPGRAEGRQASWNRIDACTASPRRPHPHRDAAPAAFLSGGLGTRQAASPPLERRGWRARDRRADARSSTAALERPRTNWPGRDVHAQARVRTGSGVSLTFTAFARSGPPQREQYAFCIIESPGRRDDQCTRDQVQATWPAIRRDRRCSSARCATAVDGRRSRRSREAATSRARGRMLSVFRTTAARPMMALC